MEVRVDDLDRFVPFKIAGRDWSFFVLFNDDGLRLA
jgi:hypothetical protein